MKKLTITVGIPAHNEEKNISYLIRSIFDQQCEHFDLEGVMVVLDGCTDQTEILVRELMIQYPALHLYSDGKRTGKAERLNQIYRMNESDILITLDADISFENSLVFERLLRPFVDEEVFVVAGNPRPLPGRTLLEKLVVAKDEWWYEARKDFHNGSNIYNSAGCCFALRKVFTKKCFFLPGTIHDQEIIYFQTTYLKKKFIFAENARIFFRNAGTWKELMSRARRFEHVDVLSGYPYQVDVIAEYRLPLKNKLRGTWKILCESPLYGIGGIALAIILKFVVLKTAPDMSQGLWEVSESTKQLF